MTYMLLVIGFVLLVKGADFFVDGSASIAKKLRVPELIIGLTIVAMGTSAPEAAVSISASLAGSNDIAISNVTGSNIFNLLVVVGASALIRPICVDSKIIRRDIPFSIIAVVLTFAMGLIFNSVFGILPSAVLLLLFVLYMFLTIRSAMKDRKLTANDEEKEESSLSMPKSILSTIVGIGAVIVGGQLVVNSATEIARTFGLSETLIGLTICAIGTSLPELVTSVVASKKGMSDLAIGNAIGSNILNFLFVFAMSSLISPVSIVHEAFIDLALLTGISILTLIFCITRKKIGRIEGGVFLLLYVIYSVYICLR